MPHSRCPGFQSQRRYGVATGAHRDHTAAKPASTALNRDIPYWTGVYLDVTPVVANNFKTSETHRYALCCETTPAYSGASQKLFRLERYLHNKTTGRNSNKPAWTVSTVQTRWLPAWPRCVTEESQRSPDSCRSNYGLVQKQSTNAGKVTVELRYDYNRGRCTPIQQH